MCGKCLDHQETYGRSVGNSNSGVMGSNGPYQPMVPMIGYKFVWPMVGYKLEMQKNAKGRCEAVVFHVPLFRLFQDEW